MIEDREPGRTPEPFRFEARFVRADRSPLVVAVMVVAFVGLAFVKPWAPAAPPADQPASPAGSGHAVAVPRPGVTPAPSPTNEAVLALCHDPLSWRTATIETWRDQTVRVWRAIVPEPATRPLDPSIPVVPAVGASVPAIGYCAPTSGPDHPVGPATIRAWRIDGGAVQTLQLRQVAPVAEVSPYGALFGPPAELGSTTSWPNGRVVFRYEELGKGASVWFAIEVSGTTDAGFSSPAPSP
jgi:hypothetical protein